MIVFFLPPFLSLFPFFFFFLKKEGLWEHWRSHQVLILDLKSLIGGHRLEESCAGQQRLSLAGSLWWDCRPGRERADSPGMRPGRRAHGLLQEVPTQDVLGRAAASPRFSPRGGFPRTLFWNLLFHSICFGPLHVSSYTISFFLTAA